MANVIRLTVGDEAVKHVSSQNDPRIQSVQERVNLVAEVVVPNILARCEDFSTDELIRAVVQVLHATARSIQTI